ncbi:MAG: gluconolactonase [SAR86 cluster bacterium]|uniref:Gluconolactonase n=1 Tax=SAR86 cluster bacterium TaxID=2030880 RepID=A0A2A5AT27_9GAMM|nr:MAG: gluconolactonase [SAR86 cluster bacterium]
MKPVKALTLIKLFFGLCLLNQAGLAQDSGLIASGAEVIEVGSGYGFLEGPVSDKSGALFFTDIDNNRIHKLATDGGLTTIYEPSNRANGLTMDLDGNLLVCEQAGQRLVILDENGNITVIADSYNGRPFNSPNDAWVHPDGSIYFTDPRYQYPAGELSQDGEYVYRISPDRQSVTAIITDIPKPNGIVGTEDGRTLYIASTELRKIYRYDLNTDGSVSNRSEFADQGSDGMTMDQHGNVYLTWVGGVSIRNPQGEQIEFISTPQMPANVGFAGADGKTLYMTARTGLYSIRMKVTASR